MAPPLLPASGNATNPLLPLPPRSPLLLLVLALLSCTLLFEGAHAQLYGYRLGLRTADPAEEGPLSPRFSPPSSFPLPSYRGVDTDLSAPRQRRDSDTYARCKDTHRCNQMYAEWDVAEASWSWRKSFFRPDGPGENWTRALWGGREGIGNGAATLTEPAAAALDFEDWEAGTAGLSTNPAYLRGHPVRVRGGGGAGAHFNSFWPEMDAGGGAGAAGGAGTGSGGVTPGTSSHHPPPSTLPPLFLNHSCTVTFDTDALLVSVECGSVPPVPVLNRTLLVNGTRRFPHPFTGAVNYDGFVVTTVNATAVNVSVPHPSWAWLASYSPSPFPDPAMDPGVRLNCTVGGGASGNTTSTYPPFLPPHPSSTSAAASPSSQQVDDPSSSPSSPSLRGSLYGGDDVAEDPYGSADAPDADGTPATVHGRDAAAAAACPPGQSYAYARNYTGLRLFTRSGSGRLGRRLEPDGGLFSPAPPTTNASSSSSPSSPSSASGVPVAVFHFASVFLGPAVKVVVRGSLPLAVVSRSALYLDTPIDVTPGTLGGFPGAQGGPLVTHTGTTGPGATTTRTYTFTVAVGAGVVREVQEVWVGVREGQTLRGSFALTFPQPAAAGGEKREGGAAGGDTTGPISPDAEPAEVERAIAASLRRAGNVSVTRVDGPLYGGYTWRLTYLTNVGDQPLIQVVRGGPGARRDTPALDSPRATGLLGVGAIAGSRTVVDGNDVGGNFTLTWRGTATGPIPVSATADMVRAALEAAWGGRGLLHARVTKSGGGEGAGTAAPLCYQPRLGGRAAGWGPAAGGGGGSAIPPAPATGPAYPSASVGPFDGPALGLGVRPSPPTSLFDAPPDGVGDALNGDAVHGPGLLGAVGGRGSGGLGYGCVNGPGPARGAVFSITLVTHVGVVEDAFPTSPRLVGGAGSGTAWDADALDAISSRTSVPFHPPFYSLRAREANVTGVSLASVGMDYAPLLGFGQPLPASGPRRVMGPGGNTTTPAPAPDPTDGCLFTPLAWPSAADANATANSTAANASSSSPLVCRLPRLASPRPHRACDPRPTFPLLAGVTGGRHMVAAAARVPELAAAAASTLRAFPPDIVTVDGSGITGLAAFAVVSAGQWGSEATALPSHPWVRPGDPNTGTNRSIEASIAQNGTLLDASYASLFAAVAPNGLLDGGIGGVGGSAVRDANAAGALLTAAGVDPSSVLNPTSPYFGGLLPYPSFADTSAWLVTATYGGAGGSHGGRGGEGHGPVSPRSPVGAPSLPDLEGGSGGAAGGAALQEVLALSRGSAAPGAIGRGPGWGGHGGGAVELVATTDLVLGRHARISVDGADGEDGYRGGGGGAGGSVLLSAGQTILLRGPISAVGGRGGDGTGTGARGGGGGSGGRVAAFAQSIAALETASSPASVAGGSGGWDEADLVRSSLSARTLRRLADEPSLPLPRPSPALSAHPAFNGKLRTDRRVLDGGNGTVAFVSAGGAVFSVETRGGGAEDTQRCLRVSADFGGGVDGTGFGGLGRESTTGRGAGISNDADARTAFGANAPGDVPLFGDGASGTVLGPTTAHAGPWVDLLPPEAQGTWWLRRGLGTDTASPVTLALAAPPVDAIANLTVDPNATLIALDAADAKESAAGAGGGGAAAAGGQTPPSPSPSPSPLVMTKPRPERVTVYVRAGAWPRGSATSQFGFHVALHDDPVEQWPWADATRTTDELALASAAASLVLEGARYIASLYATEARARAAQVLAVWAAEAAAAEALALDPYVVLDPLPPMPDPMPPWLLPSSVSANVSLAVREGNAAYEASSSAASTSDPFAYLLSIAGGRATGLTAASAAASLRSFSDSDGTRGGGGGGQFGTGYRGEGVGRARDVSDRAPSALEPGSDGFWVSWPGQDARSDPLPLPVAPPPSNSTAGTAAAGNSSFPASLAWLLDGGDGGSADNSTAAATDLATLAFNDTLAVLSTRLLAAAEHVRAWGVRLTGGNGPGGPGGANGTSLLPLDPFAAGPSSPSPAQDASVLVGVAAVNGRWAHGSNYRAVPGLAFGGGTTGTGGSGGGTSASEASRAFPQDSTSAPGPQPGRWYKVDIFLDWHNKTYKVRLDDVTVALEQPFVGDGVTRVGLYVLGRTTAWFDEVYAGADDSLGFECPYAEAEGAALRMRRPLQSSWRAAEAGQGTSAWGISRHTSHVALREMYVHELHAGLVFGDGAPQRRYFADIPGSGASALDSPPVNGSAGPAPVLPREAEGEVLAGSLLYVRGDAPGASLRQAAQTTGLLEPGNRAQGPGGLSAADPYAPSGGSVASGFGGGGGGVLGRRAADEAGVPWDGEWTGGEAVLMDTEERGPQGSYGGTTGRTYLYAEHDNHRFWAFQRAAASGTGGGGGGDGGGDGGGGGGTTTGTDDPYADDPYGSFRVLQDVTNNDPTGGGSGGASEGGSSTTGYPLPLEFVERRPWYAGGIGVCSTGDLAGGGWRNEGLVLFFANISNTGGDGPVPTRNGTWSDSLALNRTVWADAWPRNRTATPGDPSAAEAGTVPLLRGERPKVLQNFFTGDAADGTTDGEVDSPPSPNPFPRRTSVTFVLWMAVDDFDQTHLLAGVATAEHPAGPFAFRHSLRPDMNETTDLTLFQDPDTGAAYLARTYYQTTAFLLPNSIMQPTWESVKDGDGGVNYPLTFHRAFYHAGYDNPDDIWKQRWRREDVPWNITTGDFTESFSYSAGTFTLSLISTGDVVATYLPESRQSVLDRHLDRYTFRNMTGQGQLLVTSRFQDPFKPEYSLWRPSSVPAVRAQPWAENYREKNIVDNPIHPTAADLLIGPNAVVEERRTKYVVVSRLTRDFLNTTGVLRVIEGGAEGGDFLLAILSEYGRFGWGTGAEGNNNASTYQPDIYGRVRPFGFDTEPDWEDRHWQFIDTPNDRALDFRNFRDRQTDSECQDIHHVVLITHATCQRIMNHNLSYVLSPPQKNYMELVTSFSRVMDTSSYEDCLAEHERVLNKYQACIRARLPDLERLADWNVGERECVGGAGPCGPSESNRTAQNISLGFPAFDPVRNGLPPDAFEPDRTQINATTGEEAIVPSYYGTAVDGYPWSAGGTPSPSPSPARRLLQRGGGGEWEGEDGQQRRRERQRSTLDEEWAEEEGQMDGAAGPSAAPPTGRQTRPRPSRSPSPSPSPSPNRGAGLRASGSPAVKPDEAWAAEGNDADAGWADGDGDGVGGGVDRVAAAAARAALEAADWAAAAAADGDTSDGGDADESISGAWGSDSEAPLTPQERLLEQTLARLRRGGAGRGGDGAE
jgi:hypothetical protein